MKRQSAKRREWALIALIVITLSTAALYRFRYKPALQNFEQAKTSAEATSIPKDDSPDVAQLERKRDELKGMIDRKNTAVAELRSRFAQTPEETQQLRLKLSALASQSNLKVREILFPFERTLARPATAAGGEKRPLLKISAESTFAGVQNFVRGLESLGRHVSVVQFDIAAGGEVLEKLPDPKRKSNAPKEAAAPGMLAFNAVLEL